MKLRELLRQNSKLKKSSKNGVRIVQWSLPAYKVRQGPHAGAVVCPMAGSCGKAGGCYAQQGAYVWKSAKDSHTKNYELSLSNEFQDSMQDDVRRHKNRASKKNEKLVVRIHDAGDFYSLDYIRKWCEVMVANPDVQFYAYTKMVRLLKGLAPTLPSNFTVIYSEGGMQDSHIDVKVDRHSRVFSTEQELLDAGDDHAMLEFAVTQLKDPDSFLQKVNYLYALDQILDNHEAYVTGSEIPASLLII